MDAWTHIDKRKFESLCQLQTSVKELCSILKVDIDEIEKWCQNTYGHSFNSVYHVCREEGKVALRNMQWQHAKDSPQMAMFLGKKLLQQEEADEEYDLSQDKDYAKAYVAQLMETLKKRGVM